MAPAILSIRTLTRRVRRSKSASPKNARMEAEDAERSRDDEAARESDFIMSDEEDAILESDDAEVVVEICPSSSSSSSRRQHAANLVLLQYPSSSSSSSSHASSVNRFDVVESPISKDADATGPRDTALPAVRIETPLLFPVLMTPQQVPRATEIQLFLNRIEYIEINDVVEREDDVVYYILDIYRYRQQNGIPTRRRAHTATAIAATSPQSSSTPRAPVLTAPQQKQPQLSKSDSLALRVPDFQIEHRYSSFARLRANVWQIARKRHRRGQSCSYCGSLVNFFLQTDAQPNMKVKFTTTTDARKAILSKFINDLLLTTRDNHVDCARSMRGYHQIPVLMKRFLNEQTGETFFS
uniref:PX domain-containing protein n=1 Tax=Globisporangium ultimum (strain ATCC 200006 / CBS 805.95 / DAOM BR144) TaxID=431595 RepID=K3WE36_GLOUD